MVTEQALARLEELGYHAHRNPEIDAWIVITGNATIPDPTWQRVDKVARQAMRDLGHFGFKTVRMGHAEFKVVHGPDNEVAGEGDQSGGG